MAVWLQNPLFPLELWVCNGAADIADGDGKGAFPGGSLSSRITPSVA